MKRLSLVFFLFVLALPLFGDGTIWPRVTAVTPDPGKVTAEFTATGDNLSKIAKKFYGDANKYPVIFEANKPMLKHPDKIYPGQVLRIPD